MKKIIAVLICMVMIASLANFPVSALREYALTDGDISVLSGDIDFDGAVTATDARLALRGAVGLEDLNALQLRAADFTQDGALSADDARMILRTSAGLENNVTPPTEPEDPTVPVEPDTPTEHTHSYVDFACECGEVQDGHFHDFLKAWILANYTNITNGEYQVQMLVTYEDGSESVLICAYDPTLDLVALGSLLEAYDYAWMTLVTFPDDGSLSSGYIEAMDGVTAETVGSGRFELALQSYVADEPVELTEFNGYEEYREYYEAIAGIGMTEAITVLHDHLLVECGYIFGYTDMGMPSLYAGSK